MHDICAKNEISGFWKQLICSCHYTGSLLTETRLHVWKAENQNKSWLYGRSCRRVGQKLTKQCHIRTVTPLSRRSVFGILTVTQRKLEIYSQFGCVGRLSAHGNKKDFYLPILHRSTTYPLREVVRYHA